MLLPLLIAVVAMFFFGVVAIIYSIEVDRLKSRLKETRIISSMINSLEDGVFIINNSNQITTINKNAKQLLRLQKYNPTLTDILRALPNTYNFEGKIKKTILEKQKIEEKHIPYYEKLLNITISPIVSPNTTQIGALFLIHDATKEKEVAKMKEDFTSIIVHELRSPLTSIKASSEMLNREFNLTDEEKKRLTTIISEQTGKMLDQVSMILDADKKEP